MHRVLPPVSIMPTPYGLLASADIAAHQLHGTTARPAQRRRATNSQHQHGWDSAPPRARLAAPLLPSVRGGCRTMLCEDAHDRSSHSGPMPIDLQPHAHRSSRRRGEQSTCTTKSIRVRRVFTRIQRPSITSNRCALPEMQRVTQTSTISQSKSCTRRHSVHRCVLRAWPSLEHVANCAPGYSSSDY